MALLEAWVGRREGEEGWWSSLTPCPPRPSWVQEFLNEENKGLDVLLEYLSFAQCSVAYVPTACPRPSSLQCLGGGPGMLSPTIEVLEPRMLHGWA